MAFSIQVQADTTIDSLQNLLKNNKIDTTQVNLLCEIGLAFEVEQKEMAIESANKALLKATQLDFVSGMAKANHTLGILFQNDNSPKEARAYFRKALSAYQKIGDQKNSSISLKAIGFSSKILGELDEAMESFYQSTTIDKATNNQNLLAEAYTSIAEIYWKKGNIQQSINNIEKALKAREALQDKVGIAESYNSIAVLYNEMNDLKKSLEYSLKSLETFKRVGDKSKMATSYGNTGRMYKKMADYEASLKLFEKELQLAEEVQDKELIAMACNNLGELYTTLKENKKALQFHERSLMLAREVQNNNIITSNLIGFSKIYLENKQLDKALNFAKNAFVKAQKLSSPELIRDAALILSKVYATRKTFDKAYQYQLIYKAESDKILNEDNIRQMAARESKYEFEKETEIQKLEQEKQSVIHQTELQQQKNLLNWIMGVATLLALLVFFVYRSYRTKQTANIELTSKNKIILQSHEALETEKLRSEKLLLNILPQAIAEELKSKGNSKSAICKHYDRVSIIFSDFEGFTKIAANMHNDVLIEELNTCFTAFDGIILRNNLEKIKTLGDGYMCAGGVPKTNQTNPVDAVLAALEMQAFIKERKIKKVAAGQEYWSCRLGINTGPVNAGVIGFSKFAYDIWGNAVNIASRMENSGEPDQINISEHTYLLIKDFFDCSFRGERLAKNGLLLNMYFVHRIKKNLSADAEGICPNNMFLELKKNVFV